MYRDSNTSRQFEIISSVLIFNWVVTTVYKLSISIPKKKSRSIRNILDSDAYVIVFEVIKDKKVIGQ